MASPLFFVNTFFLWNWTTNQLVVPACFFFQIRYTQGRGKKTVAIGPLQVGDVCVESALSGVARGSESPLHLIL